MANASTNSGKSGTAAPRVKQKRMTGGSSRLGMWLGSIWRQRWLSLTSAWILCAVGWAAVALWPSHYMSSAVVYADLHRLIDQETLAKSEAGNGSSEQDPVALLRGLLLNEESLSEVRNALILDDLSASSLGNDIMIGSTAPTLFVASYHHKDPGTAHQVLERLFQGLSERSSEAASEEAVGLQQQVAKLQDQVQKAEENLAKFQQANASLVEDAAGQTAEIPELEQEVADLRQKIDNAVIERDDIAGQLAQLPLEQQQVSEASAEGGLSESQAEELAGLEAKLAELRERYADSHPYVSAVVKAIETLTAEADTAQQAGAESREAEFNEQLDALKRQHEEKIAELAAFNNELANKQREIDHLSALTDSTTSVEAEQSRLEQAIDDLEASLVNLVARGGALERQTDNETGQEDGNVGQTSFRLINGPNLPDKPTGPARLLCLALVLLGGVTVGGGIAVLRNRSKGVFESAWQLKQRFDVGVLGTVSEVLSPAEQKRLGHSRLVFGLCCAGLLCLFSGLAVAELMNVLTPWGDRLRTELLG